MQEELLTNIILTLTQCPLGGNASLEINGLNEVMVITYTSVIDVLNCYGSKTLILFYKVLLAYKYLTFGSLIFITLESNAF